MKTNEKTLKKLAKKIGISQIPDSWCLLFDIANKELEIEEQYKIFDFYNIGDINFKKRYISKVKEITNNKELLKIYSIVCYIMFESHIYIKKFGIIM